MLAIVMSLLPLVAVVLAFLWIWRLWSYTKASDQADKERLHESAVMYGVSLVLVLVVLATRIFSLPAILLMLTLMSGLMVLVDALFWKGARQRAGLPIPEVLDYAWSLFPVFFLVVLVRSFLFQPYEVPTGSLEPTVIPVEYLFVTQWNYGMHLPLWGTTLWQVGHPKRGEIALFKWPVNKKYDFVKRVVGVPGDRISYIHKTFYINGVEAKRHLIGTAYDTEPGRQPKKVQIWEENLLGIKHNILIDPNQPAQDFKNLIVPKGEYVMIGDNRDDSDDSRYWGFVPENTFVGKVHRVLLSLDYQHRILGFFPRVRWHRIGVSVEPVMPKKTPSA
jgi:signal peptidase I